MSVFVISFYSEDCNTGTFFFYYTFSSSVKILLAKKPKPAPIAIPSNPTKPAEGPDFLRDI
jgi:hypothetical protein